MEYTSTLLKKLEDANKLIADQKYALDQAAIVAITDTKGVITYVNQQFCDISGYSRDELIGQTHKIVNSGYHDKFFFEDLWNTLAAGEVWRGEIRNRSKSGRIYWVDTTIVPLLDRHQKPERYISIRTDITLRKEAEAELELDRNKLFMAEKMASLGVLSAGLAHELGNPLGALRGRAEMLERLAENEEPVDKLKLKESGKVIIDLIDRMAKIIRGLRAYSRDGCQDPFVQVDIGRLIDDIVEISRDRCRKFQVDVNLKGINKGILCWGREAELAQVIVNLFNNAIDAVKDEPERWVRFELSVRDDRYISLRVIDSGPGIPKNVVSKIFDPFFTSKEVGQGTGLGLTISNSIVDAHDGLLSLRKVSGHTCFEVLLPKVKKQLGRKH